MGNEIKVDLDLEDYDVALNQIKERLLFIKNQFLISVDIIDKVELLSKSSYSVKIHFNKKTEDIYILIFQAILGDDWRRTTVSFADYLQGKQFWNKLFDVKRYNNGSYIQATYYDITEEVLNHLNNPSKNSITL